MKFKRIFAGSVVALLLSVSTFAGACDLSCAFASMASDCHAREVENPASQSSNMNMADMSMAGMTMSDMGGGDSIYHQMVSGPSQTMPGHTAVMDIGTCEHQSCDQTPVLVARAKRPAAAKADAVRALTGFPCISGMQSTLHDARDGLGRSGPVIRLPLGVSLRI